MDQIKIILDVKLPSTASKNDMSKIGNIMAIKTFVPRQTNETKKMKFYKQERRKVLKRNMLIVKKRDYCGTFLPLFPAYIFKATYKFRFILLLFICVNFDYQLNNNSYLVSKCITVNFKVMNFFTTSLTSG